MNRGRHKKNKNNLCGISDLKLLEIKYSEYKLYECSIIFIKNKTKTNNWKFNVYDGKALFQRLQQFCSKKYYDELYINFRFYPNMQEKYKIVNATIYI